MAKGIWIRKRSGRKEVWITFKDQQGRKRREKIGPDTTQFRRLAKEALQKRLGEVVEGRYFPERAIKSITFGEMAKKYLEVWAVNKSRFAADRMPPLLLEWKDRRLTDISTADILGFYNKKAKDGSYGNANRYLTLIKSIFNRAIEWGDYRGVNPACKVPVHREPPHRTRYLEDGEIEKFLKACDARLRPLAICAILTGLRRGELFGLRWENIDLRQRLLHVLKSKSGKAREIYIVPQLEDLLLGLEPKKEGLVFTLPYGTFRKLFDAAVEDSGVKAFHWHDLRHTFASHFIMKNADLPALQKILGHSTPTMTLRYAHLSQGHIKTEMEIFAASIPALQTAPIKEIGHQNGHQARAIVEARVVDAGETVVKSNEVTAFGQLAQR